jgi:hypothetical protein
MSFFPKVNKWRLPGDLLRQSIDEMALDGRCGNEGTCLWLGNRARGEATVTHVVFLRGPGVQKSPVNVRLSAELMRLVHDRADAQHLTLLAQIHSHSRWSGVNMSPTDHAYGISVPFFLSVICPDYAQNPATRIGDCGVHVFLPGEGYMRLTERQLSRKLVEAPGCRAEVLIAGEDL